MGFDEGARKARGRLGVLAVGRSRLHPRWAAGICIKQNHPHVFQEPGKFKLKAPADLVSGSQSLLKLEVFLSHHPAKTNSIGM